MQLWAELRTRNIAPDLRTLNMLMRCLSKTATDPDHAEHIMSEVCALGDLTPNATTHILLAEIRVRFEQLLGL
ncbi:hypothetical protein DUNSADRAFT_18507 [Dunaliella salina]|uniref:Encoded protein n=1 Tax=Dunaliella salina TaxID=3046 RepID=A0ABQ7GZ07_DUNSA|nr:hypothetical protein DUNSADRAFT_18507 [Dunaliella salina]|eukprot:KAF5839845.1 hypothetical protein DUNSADRAFT_18507 [Dunaliella salina]